jgi:hypothetical protein
MTKLKHSAYRIVFLRYSMKMGSFLVGLAVVLVVVGAGLSYSGYNESLRVSTQSFTSTSTQTVTSTGTHEYTSTETHLSTTTGSESILDETFDLEGEGVGHEYCYWQFYNVTIDAGQVQVSYSSSVHDQMIDFWLLDEKGLALYKSEPSCLDLRAVAGIVHSFSSSTYDADVTIPSSGLYYVMFLNRGTQDETITVKIDTVPKETVVTMTEEHTYTYYSTEQTPLVTEEVTLSTQHGQLGVLFYCGIGLVIVAVILLAFSVVRRKPSPAPTRVPSPGPAGVAPPAVTPPPPPAVAMPSPPVAQPLTGKFCMNCGASLLEHAIFCKRCGSKQ